MSSTETNPPPQLPATPTPSLIQRVGSVFLRLAQLVGDRLARDRSAANVARVLMAQERLMNLSSLLRNLIARIDAGTVAAPRPRKAALAVARPAARSAMPKGSLSEAEKPALPRKFGWLRHHAGPDYHHVNWGIGQVEQLLLEPETLAKLEQAPLQAGRLVRPLCHMLGIGTPSAFKLPPRPRPARVRKVQAPRWVMPFGSPRVASARWPKGCVSPGETISLRKRNRTRQRRNE